MEAAPGGFWAKLCRDEDGRISGWKSLVAHSAEVAAVAEALLKCSILGPRCAHLLGRQHLDEPRVGRLCVLSALHDVGKVNHEFQDRAARADGRRGGHVSPLVNFLKRGEAQVIEALGLAGMADWFETEEDFIAFLLAAFGHHGLPVTPKSEFRARLWASRGGRDPLGEMARIRQEVEQWFPAAFGPGVEPFPNCPALQHAFNGLLTLADWIASDERLFPLRGNSPRDVALARPPARRALVALGLLADQARGLLGPSRPSFDMICGFEPHPVQRASIGLTDDEGGSLTIIESDTGSGKTEAALARFVQMFHAGLVDGLYFALPTRAAATQMHGRVVEAMKNAFGDSPFRPPVVLAVPGYLRVDETYGQLLAPFEVLWDDDLVHQRGWAAEHPKRYLAGTVAVGTVDQVLLSALQVRHAHLRATALLRHLLVVDEVHASDAYMGRLLEEVLGHHIGAGGHALLMSATLGSAARNRFLATVGVRTEPAARQEAAAAPYPLITHAAVGRAELTAPQATGYRKRVSVRAEPLAGTPREVARIALDAASVGARVLVIRNTVKGCVATQRALESLAGRCNPHLFRSASVSAPHHSRFAAPDRRALDRAVELAFGKHASEHGVAAIATQTVEQSLDLDADLLLTDLCPVDVLLQRIGRLHRHPQQRPPAARPECFRSPQTVILVPEKRSLAAHITASGKAAGPHGLGTVYDDLRILEATWRLIEREPEWTIPDMNRQLVEAGTHPDALDSIVEELGPTWPLHARRVIGLRAADTTIANLSLLPRDEPFGACTFPRQLDERIKTRLGEADRRVEFDPPLPGPFGAQVAALNLPWHYAPDAADDAVAENARAVDGGFAFDFAGRTFTYTRLGLHPAGADYLQETAYD